MSTSVKNDPLTVDSMLDRMSEHLKKKRLQRERKERLLKQKTYVPLDGRVKRSPRIALPGRVLLVKNDRYLKGRSVNISNTGIFVETYEKVFEEQELVRVIIKPDGPRKTFKLVARVVRFNSNLNQQRGYGLEFVRPIKLVLKRK